MQEVWEPYLYNYEISNLGRIRNVKTQHILKPSLTGHGYLACVVSMGKKGKWHSIKIHRAVAETFLPNPNHLPQVNHKDGNKLNNIVDNLEWCDNQYNTTHALHLGLRVPVKGEAHTNHKLTKEDVVFIRTHYIPRDHQFGIRALSRRFGVHHETIRHALHGESWN